MAIDVIHSKTSERRTDRANREDRRAEIDLTDLNVSDLSAAGVHEYVRATTDAPVHLERRGARTILVVETDQTAEVREVETSIDQIAR